MADHDRSKKEPLPLSALDDDPPVAPRRIPPATTKPVRYAPLPSEGPEPNVVVRDMRAAETPAPATGATKLTPYLPGEDDAEPSTSPAGPGVAEPDPVVAPTAKGYAVEGFTPNYRPEGDVAPNVVMAAPFVPRGFGDAAGEHLAIKRPRRAAWEHVVIAFVLEAAAFGALFAWVAREIALRLGAGAGEAAISAWTGGVALGLVLSYAVFRDRFRCIEAVASRYTIEAAFLSVLWVPFVALGYANVRGVRKLAGR